MRVFSAKTSISAQTVRTCQPVFSAALIAHVEAASTDDDAKNSLCRPTPNREVPLDWLRMMLMYNGINCAGSTSPT